MSATVSIVKRIKMGNAKASIVDITFDASYPTGGESVTPGQVGLEVVQGFICEANSGYTFEYVRSTKKLKALAPIGVVAGDGVADANNTLMKSATGTLEVAGTGTAFQQAAVEVANAADLHTVTTRAFVIGW